MSDSMKHMKAMADSALATQEYMGSDALKHVDAMLEALEELYKGELADVEPENLVRLQAQLKQTKIIRQVLRKEAALPKL
jgi:hypothetical protein